MSVIRSVVLLVALWGVLFSDVAAADKVVALVNGQPVMESELDAFTEKVPAPFREAFKKKALQQVIDARLFYDLGRKSGMKETEAYRSKMAKAEQMIVSDLFVEKKLKSEVTVTEKEMTAYYRENRSRFVTPKKILPGHILIKDRDTAQGLQKKISELGFDVVADQLSKNDPSARYFKLNWTEKGKSRMPKEFEDAAFALNAGGISQVVQSPIGYHIIKVFEDTPAEEKSFDQVKENIRAHLGHERLNRLKQRYIDAADIKIVAEDYQ